MMISTPNTYVAGVKMILTDRLIGVLTLKCFNIILITLLFFSNRAATEMVMLIARAWKL